jgi:threonine/homoserine/homoserine lactone efflux protein
MLLCIAASILRGPPPAPPEGPVRIRLPRAQGLAAFLAGYGTAVSNPVTATFLAAQFLGPLGRSAGGLGIVLPMAALATALAWWLGVALLMVRPPVQEFVRARHRPIRVAASAALAAMALPMLWPLLAFGAGDATSSLR